MQSGSKLDERGTSQNKIHLVLLFLILAVAFAIRFKGIWFGYPLSTHADEPKLVETALGMLSTGDLNPHFFNYPTLNIYLHALIYHATSFFLQLFSGLSPTHIPQIWFYIIGRAFNVLLSTLTILVTYEIGRRLVSPFVGLASACFIAVSFLHVTNSFIITVDSSMALWTSLSALMAVLIYTRGKKLGYYLLGGVFVGLAISSKYPAFVCVAPILIAHFKISCGNKDWIDKNIIASLILIPVAFFITSPYVLLDYEAFSSAVEYEAYHYRSGHPGAEAAGAMSFHLYGNYLVTQGYGLYPILLAGFGLIWFLRNDPWKATMLLSTPVLLFLFVGQYKVFFPRNIVSVIPFLSLFSGIAIYAGFEWLKGIGFNWKNPRWKSLILNTLIIAALVGSILNPLFNAVNHIQRITLPDTRWVSLQWTVQNVPPGAHIGREHYTPPVEKYTEQYDVSYLGYFAVDRKPKEVGKLDYMIVSTGDFGRFFDSPDKYANETRSYMEFFKENELVREFNPSAQTMSGPKISIYKIRKDFSE